MIDFVETSLALIVVILIIVFAIYQTGKQNECTNICTSFDYSESNLVGLSECKCLANMENGTKYYKPLNELLARK